MYCEPLGSPDGGTYGPHDKQLTRALPRTPETDFHTAARGSRSVCGGRGKYPPRSPATLAENAGVDANQLAARVDERAAGVARVDRRVGLNEIFVVRESKIRPAGCAHDA